MASTSKAFKKCVDPCPRYLTPDDTHDCCVFCLGEEHARGVFEGAICVHCELFSMRKLRSHLSLFSRKEGQPSASRDLGPTATEARRRMKSWGSQADLADELERELSLSHESAGNESKNAPRRGFTCRGSEPRWRRRRDASMSDTSPAINPQLRWAFHSFLISIQRLRWNGKSRFPPASTGFSILVMLTLPGCVKAAMRGCHL